jgi:hypothetical protein
MLIFGEPAGPIMPDRRFPLPWSVDDPDTKLGRDGNGPCVISRMSPAEHCNHPATLILRFCRAHRSMLSVQKFEGQTTVNS